MSGRTVGKTALAWLTGAPDASPSLAEDPRDTGLNKRHGDRTLVDALVARRPHVVALDAPLASPHAVTCDEPACPQCFPASGDSPSYGRRQLEQPDRWTALSPGMKGPMPSVMIAAISFRAIYLRRALERQGLTVIETWPMGVYRMLDVQAAGSGPAPSLDEGARTSILAEVIDGLESSAAAAWSRDSLDAVAAAYAAWCWATGRGHAVRGDNPEEGEIWVPEVV